MTKIYYTFFLTLSISCFSYGQQWSSSGNNIYNTNSGNVGIGTTNPSAQLHLASDSDHSLRISRANGMYGLRIFRNAGAGVFSIQNTDNNNTWGTRIRIEEGGTNWQNLILNPDGGNVGIGTILPTFTLDVEGNGTRIKNSAATLNSYTTFRIQGPNYSNGLEIDFFGNNNITGDLNWSYGGGPGSGAIVNVNPKPLIFGTNNTGRMLIDANGNIGIGTTTPGSYRLAVEGKISARQEVRVFDFGIPFPDYVFHNTYKLQSLPEVESYIKANNHLPEVPSAEEVECNGMNLAEMNILMLKKVEELTLHLIEQNKQIAEQNKRLEMLKQENETLKTRVDGLEEK